VKTSEKECKRFEMVKAFFEIKPFELILQTTFYNQPQMIWNLAAIEFFERRYGYAVSR